MREALLEGRSEIRNRVIARVFKELGYIEQWGSGIQRIKSACIAQGLAEPRIREKGDFVDVEFYRPAAGAIPNIEGENSSAPADNRRIPADAITPQEQLILSHIKATSTVSAAVAVTLLAVRPSRAREILKAMTEKGLLEKRGQARSTCYVLAQKPKDNGLD